MDTPIIHFLLVYNVAQRELEETRQFTDIEEAVEAYELAERSYLGRGTHEVVLLGADSLDTIMITHGGYFTGNRGDQTPRAGLTVHFGSN